MPSFATEVKNELAHGAVRRKCCQSAELAALLRMGASMTIGTRANLGLNFTTENAREVDRILEEYLVPTSFDPGACTRGLYLRGVE